MYVDQREPLDLRSIIKRKARIMLSCAILIIPSAMNGRNYKYVFAKKPNACVVQQHIFNPLSPADTTDQCGLRARSLINAKSSELYML